jgi:hypothetical protein
MSGKPIVFWLKTDRGNKIRKKNNTLMMGAIIRNVKVGKNK